MPFKFQYDDKGKVVYPTEYLADMQEFLEAAFEKADAEQSKEWLAIFNEGAKRYNKKAGKDIYQIFSSLNHLKSAIMATSKKATAAKSADAKKAAAPKKAAGKKAAAPKKAASKKAQPDKKPRTKAASGDKPLTQKEQIVLLADQGKTINEIVELTGFKKNNVAWYFSKLKLHPKK